MSTKDFVESSGRKRVWEIVKEEMKALHDESGMLRKELQRGTQCCVCEKEDSDFLFEKEGFTFVKCKSCGLLYVNPQCDESRLNEFYSGGGSLDAWVDVLLSPPEQEYDIKKFTAMCIELEKAVEGRRVLDVGCSIGLFNKIARDRGWDPVGLELNKKAVDYAVNTLGLDVRPQLLHEADLEKESFDVLTLWEVIEHVPDPRALLKACREMIRPGGVLALLVPNRDALSARVMRNHCSCFGGRNHLWYFADRHLTALLADAGFEVFFTGTQLSQVEEILTFLNYKNPYYDERGEGDFDLDADLKKKLEKFIFDNNLGYKLLMYARKV